MKDDYTTNSHYLIYTFLFRKVGRMYFLNLGVNPVPVQPDVNRDLGKAEVVVFSSQIIGECLIGHCSGANSVQSYETAGETVAVAEQLTMTLQHEVPSGTRW